MTNPAINHAKQQVPIVLKELIIQCDINQVRLARALDVSRPTINLCVNKGYIPSSISDFAARVEAYLVDPVNDFYERVQMWLKGKGIAVQGIWAPLGKSLHWIHPVGAQTRIQRSIRSNKSELYISDPDLIEMNQEVEMIKQEALKKLKIFRQPFTNDVTKEADIYLSEDHRYIKEAMLEAARNKGLVAIVGEVGSGKSTIRKSVIAQLKRDGTMQVVYPRIISKKQITASSLCDAIIMDISDETPKNKHEHKSRQVLKLLTDRVGIGVDCCLIVEEAHRLNIEALQNLKQFWELEDGFSRLLGIILIGQPELEDLMNESSHPDLRELIRRTQLVKIGGLNGDLRSYLTHKFKRVGADIDKIITDDAIKALSARLTAAGHDGKSKISHAYPLLVNNWITRAINTAHEYGEPIVTEEIINAL